MTRSGKGESLIVKTNLEIYTRARDINLPL